MTHTQHTPTTAPAADRCEFSTCRRPATHRVASCGRYYEDVCSSHVAPAIHSELKWVTADNVASWII